MVAGTLTCLPLGRPLSAAAVAVISAVAVAGALDAWPASAPPTVTVELGAGGTGTSEPGLVGLAPRLVPLSGTEWRDRGDARCLAFLSSWVEHPGWTLRLERGYSTCTGDTVIDGLSIDGAGRVSWLDGEGRARATVLPEREWAELVAAAEDDCLQARVDGEGRPAPDWVAVSWTGARPPDLRVRNSPAFDRLDRVLERVADHYHEQRLIARGRYALSTTLRGDDAILLGGRPLQLTVHDDGRLVIRRAGHLRVVRLERDLQVAALDWFERDRADVWQMPRALMSAIVSAQR